MLIKLCQLYGYPQGAITARELYLKRLVSRFQLVDVLSYFIAIFLKFAFELKSKAHQRSFIHQSLKRPAGLIIATL